MATTKNGYCISGVGSSTYYYEEEKKIIVVKKGFDEF